MRRHFCLITESPHDDRVGSVAATETKYTVAEKNAETRLEKRNLDTGETYEEQIVGLGYHDFDGQGEYEESSHEVIVTKLAEIDESYLEKAGINAEEVFDRE